MARSPIKVFLELFCAQRRPLLGDQTPCASLFQGKPHHGFPGRTRFPFPPSHPEEPDRGGDLDPLQHHAEVFQQPHAHVPAAERGTGPVQVVPGYSQIL